MLEKIMEDPEMVKIGILTSILATVIVLFTQYIFKKVLKNLPAYKIFNLIKGSNEECLVHIVRLKDPEQTGKYLTPLPSFSTFPINEPIFEGKQLIPWVVSSEDSNATSIILNTLGKIGRTENIKLGYVDELFEEWENPMFLIGGSKKIQRVFDKFQTTYFYKDGAFINRETKMSFRQKNKHDDLGLLLKCYNTTTEKPIWICMGLRGAGTAGAAYALSKWWKILAKIYGNKEFGLVVQFNDNEGWRDATPVSYYPEPSTFRKVLFPFTHQKFKKLLKQY